MWSYFLSSACGDMPNTQNVPYRVCSGCLDGGGSEGGCRYGKGDPVSWLASGGSRISRLSPWGGCSCKNEGREGHVCKNVVSCARTSPLGGPLCCGWQVGALGLQT